MFNSVELGLKLSKEEYNQRLPKLRSDLLEVQQSLKETPLSVVVVVAGVEGAGKADVVNTLTEWLDPRGVETNVFWAPSDEERARPMYWRFWRTLPARGKIGIFFGSWYTDPIIRRVTEASKNAEFDREMQRVASFEKMLADDGTLMVKLWFHLSKKAQRKRLKKLEGDPDTSWRVTPQDWKFHKMYDEFAAVSERAIRFTDSGDAPWHLIDATDTRHRTMEAGRLLLESLQQRLAKLAAAPKRTRVVPACPKTLNTVTVLDRVDTTKKMAPEDYKKKLKKYQAELNQLSWQAHTKKIATVAVFEGWDAAGKGGAIRRVTGAVDAKLTRAVSIAAPSDEERAHHYLWRFWRRIPAAGRVTIFDRSWYGRVLVERVEGFATPEEWMRSYLEINEFEAQLVDSGIVLLKFWLHITPEEQLRRFKEREKIDFKRYKITDEDWRNREKWNAYKLAINDMIARNSTDIAPWTIIPGTDKLYARIQVLKTFCDAMKKAL
jgi:polyphosphate:AMP phosphotransferase